MVFFSYIRGLISVHLTGPVLWKRPWKYLRNNTSAWCRDLKLLQDIPSVLSPTHKRISDIFVHFIEIENSHILPGMFDMPLKYQLSTVMDIFRNRIADKEYQSGENPWITVPDTWKHSDFRQCYPPSFWRKGKSPVVASFLFFCYNRLQKRSLYHGT